MQGPYFLVFVFLPLVAARLIKVHKQCEMCSLMSKCFCKRALSLGSWPCQLKPYPNPVSCISGLTTSPFSPASFVSSISSFSLFSHFLYSTSHGNYCSLYLLTGGAESLQLYFAPCKSDTVINDDLRLPSLLCSFRVASKEVGVDKVPGGVYGTGWLTK